jgi:hypothetical protein
VKVISQFTTAPVSDFVTVAENVPRAALTSPFGAGTSWAAFIDVFSWIVVAWVRATAPPATVRARTSAPANALEASFFTRFSLLVGSHARPVCEVLRATLACGLPARALRMSERRVDDYSSSDVSLPARAMISSTTADLASA